MAGNVLDMRLDRFTEKAQEALQAAARLVEEAGQQAVEPDHLLLALLRQEDGIARPVLQAASVTVPGLEGALVSRVESFPRVSGGGSAFLSSAAQAALESAEKEAQRLQDEYVSTDHMLLALSDLPVANEHGASHDALLAALRQVRGSHRVTDPEAE